jgi:hypothetical protein
MRYGRNNARNPGFQRKIKKAVVGHDAGSSSRGIGMTNQESDLLNSIFKELEANDGRPDLELLEALTRLSLEAKAEFVRRMDDWTGFGAA